jgi:hypothetical protein
MAIDNLNSRIKEQQKLERDCVEVDDEIAGLRNAYEQYFMGLERKPPVLRHDALKRRMAKLRNAPLRNTVLKFRIGTLEQKLKTYERMWDRTLKEMENGTYRRDLAKMRRKREEAARAAGPQDASAPQRPGEPSPQQAVTQVPHAAPLPPQSTVAVRPGTPPRTPPAGGGNAISEDKVKAIYDAYVTAKRRCQEDTSRLSLDAMASTLRKQVPELLKKHNAKEIDFKVVIKDGKAVLRAVPK